MTWQEEIQDIRERVRAKAQGCCGDASWRGRFCEYHNGYFDGLMEAVRMIEDDMTEIVNGPGNTVGGAMDKPDEDGMA